MPTPNSKMDELLNQLNVTTAELARQIGICPTALSKEINSKDGPAEYHAERIILILEDKYGSAFISRYFSYNITNTYVPKVFVSELKHFQSQHRFSMASISRDLGYEDRHISRTFRKGTEEEKEALLDIIHNYVADITHVPSAMDRDEVDEEDFSDEIIKREDLEREQALVEETQNTEEEPEIWEKEPEPAVTEDKTPWWLRLWRWIRY